MQVNLFTPFKLNDSLSLANRIVMAPMTRSKAASGNVPTEQMAQYYARRADAGLIVTEGTVIRPDAIGYPDVPGVYTDEQITGWQAVTKAVHDKGGKIFNQIWHVGRVSHPSFLNGELPVSPSATIMSGPVRRSEGLHYGKSRELSREEIEALVACFAQAATNARKAGFDGIEIHGANGYLIDQFLHYDTNHRQDAYGGDVESIARFALDVVKACGEAIGFDRVGLRLSPGAYLNEIKGDARDKHVFAYLLRQLNDLNIAYVHTGNFDDHQIFAELDGKTMTAFMREHYKGTLIASGSYTSVEAKEYITNDSFDLVAFGRPFIANPDLVTRLRDDKPLKEYDVGMLGDLY